MIGTADLAVYLSKFDRKYWLTYKVLDILQKVRACPAPSLLWPGCCHLSHAL